MFLVESGFLLLFFFYSVQDNWEKDSMNIIFQMELQLLYF